MINFTEIINDAISKDKSIKCGCVHEDGDGGGGDGADDPTGNTSDSHTGYNTPNAFGNKPSCGCKGKSCSCGTKLKEDTYKEYKLDQSYSHDKDKVNKSIKLLYSALCEIEKKLTYTSKFKNETGMDDAKLLKSTKGTLIKLKTKANNIMELIDSIYNQTDEGEL